MIEKSPSLKLKPHCYIQISDASIEHSRNYNETQLFNEDVQTYYTNKTTTYIDIESNIVHTLFTRTLVLSESRSIHM